MVTLSPLRQPFFGRSFWTRPSFLVGEGRIIVFYLFCGLTMSRSAAWICSNAKIAPSSFFFFFLFVSGFFFPVVRTSWSVGKKRFGVFFLTQVVLFWLRSFFFKGFGPLGRPFRRKPEPRTRAGASKGENGAFSGISNRSENYDRKSWPAVQIILRIMARPEIQWFGQKKKKNRDGKSKLWRKSRIMEVGNFGGGKLWSFLKIKLFYTYIGFFFCWKFMKIDYNYGRPRFWSWPFWKSWYFPPKDNYFDIYCTFKYQQESNSHKQHNHYQTKI